MTEALVLTAVDLEARALARHLGLAAAAGEWPHYRGGALEVMAIGLGAAYLEQRLARHRGPDLVLSAGLCGALAPALTVGQLVVPEYVLAEDGARHRTDGVPGLERRGVLVSVRAAADTPAAKARLWVRTGALAADMESAAVIRWARGRGLRVAVVRGVSDTAQQSIPADLAAVVEPGGRVRTAAALRAALRRPRVVSDALALKRGVDRALRAVAAALAAIARS